MTRIRATLTEDGATAAKKTRPHLGNEREGTSVGGDQRNHRNGALSWPSLITRYAPNTAPREQSLRGAILTVKTFPREPTAYDVALDEWQENIRKWAPISGDLFNVSMKKISLFLENAPSSVRHLDTFEAMAARTLQFLQHNAQYQAGVTVTSNNRRGPNDMEIDALTKKGKGYKGKGAPSKTDGQKTSHFVCGRLGHMAKDCWFKETNKGSGPNNKGKKGTRQKAKDSKATRQKGNKAKGQKGKRQRRLHREEPQPAKPRESPKTPTLGIVPSPWRMKMI